MFGMPSVLRCCAVAPVRERGLKSIHFKNAVVESTGRSREGAWIEIYMAVDKYDTSTCRSREGAWIEIH